MLVSAIRRRLLRWLLRGIEEAGEQINSACRARSAMGGLTPGQQEILRQVEAALVRHLGHQRAPPPWHAVFAPHMHGGVGHDLTGQVAQLLRDSGIAAQIADEVVMSAHAEIVQKMFEHVNARSLGDTLEAERQSPRMGDKTSATRDPYAIECGARLRRFRTAVLGYTNASRFAEITGVSLANLSNWERGVSLVPPWYVQKLKEIFGLTHDFVYGGDASSLKQEHAVMIAHHDPKRGT